MPQRQNLILMSFGLLFLSSTLAAEHPAQDARDSLNLYDSQFITVNYGFFVGISLQYQGQSASARFGLGPNLSRVLQSHAGSDFSFRRYRTKNRIGGSLVIGGMALLLAGILCECCMPYESWAYSWDVTTTAAVVGSLSTAIGLVIQKSGYRDLLNAVNIYNRGILENGGV